jgi:type II secretory pathway pseudopilin PulG
MKKHNQGFTLIETLIAIFLLTLTIGGLLTLAADGYFSVRYAKNQIIADNLLQEGLEYVRNDRDSSVQQGVTWQDWTAKYAVCMTGNNNGYGCMVDPYTTTADRHVVACDATCDPFIFYPSTGFYGYGSPSGYPAMFTQSGGATNAAPYATIYTRTMSMSATSEPNQVILKATVSWYNGRANQTESQSVLLTNWHVTTS